MLVDFFSCLSQLLKMNTKIFAYRETSLFDSVVKSSSFRHEEGDENFRDLYFSDKRLPFVERKESFGYGYAFGAHLADGFDPRDQSATRNRYVIW